MIQQQDYYLHAYDPLGRINTIDTTFRLLNSHKISKHKIFK